MDTLQEVHGIMKPYQRDVSRTMILNRKWLNYMDMGLGKSLVTSFSVMYTQAFPCMIVCPKSAMGVWQDELKKWFDMDSILYVGNPKKRNSLFKQFMTGGYKFIITNYSLCGELGQLMGIVPVVGNGVPKLNGAITLLPHKPGTFKLGSIIADEIQVAGLFNHKTQTYKIFEKLCKTTEYVYLLTGTPYRRGVIDFYGPLSLVAPDEFDSYWKYVGRYCVTIDTGFGKSIERNPKDVPKFRNMLREYSSILKKEEYLDELPGKVRQVIPIEMEREQKRVYKELTEEMFAETDSGELVMTPSVLALSVRQRQLLVCPQELGLKERGAAIDTLIEMSETLVEERKPFVIFTPFRKAIPWIREALKSSYPGIRIYEISGGLTPDEFTAQWQGFQHSNSGSGRVLICVIKSGASFHATSADTAFFLGYEWDFNQNAQAEDRLNRLGQKKLVTCYYLMHRGTIDEDIAQRLNDKKYGSDLILTEDNVYAMMRDRVRR